MGYAARFFDRSNPGTEFRLSPDMVERLHPEAFDAALEREDDVVALFNHDANFPLGRTTAGTLTLSVDELGLSYSVEPPDTTAGRDVLTSLQRGDINGSSFGFQIEQQRFFEEDSVHVREITQVRLIDVSPVTYPAYSATTSEARSVADQYELFTSAQKQHETLARCRHALKERGII